MATNFYFNNFSSKGDQNLIEDLIIESIKIYGVDAYYLPRTIVNLSKEFREQEYSRYDQALNLEMYVKNIDGFEGEGEFLSSFGVEVREQITFSIANKRFKNEVGDLTFRDRPFESDLIWFPFNKALYQIKYVNLRPVFYQMGVLQFYDVTCELFEYSNEIFNTGIAVIDTTYNALKTQTQTYNILLEDGTQLYTENNVELFSEEYDVEQLSTNSQNTDFDNITIDFVDFTEIDPFSERQSRV